MSDVYTKTCFSISNLPANVGSDIVSIITTIDGPTENFPDSAFPDWFSIDEFAEKYKDEVYDIDEIGLSFDIIDGDIVFYSDCYFNIPLLCYIFKEVLNHHKQYDDYIYFTWADTTSKTLVDGYGGGAAVCTAHKVKIMSTSSWVEDTLKTI